MAEKKRNMSHEPISIMGRRAGGGGFREKVVCRAGGGNNKPSSGVECENNLCGIKQ